MKVRVIGHDAARRDVHIRNYVRMYMYLAYISVHYLLFRTKYRHTPVAQATRYTQWS